MKVVFLVCTKTTSYFGMDAFLLYFLFSLISLKVIPYSEVQFQMYNHSHQNLITDCCLISSAITDASKVFREKRNEPTLINIAIYPKLCILSHIG